MRKSQALLDEYYPNIVDQYIDEKCWNDNKSVTLLTAFPDKLTERSKRLLETYRRVSTVRENYFLTYVLSFLRGKAAEEFAETAEKRRETFKNPLVRLLFDYAIAKTSRNPRKRREAAERFFASLDKEWEEGEWPNGNVFEDAMAIKEFPDLLEMALEKCMNSKDLWIRHEAFEAISSLPPSVKPPVGKIKKIIQRYVKGDWRAEIYFDILIKQFDEAPEKAKPFLKELEAIPPYRHDERLDNVLRKAKTL